MSTPDGLRGSAGNQVQSVARALDLLFLVAEAKKPMPIPKIAAELGLPRPTVYRLAETLIKYEVIAREQNVLVPAPRLFRLANGNRSAANIEDVLRPHLHRLRDITGETTGLHVRQGIYRRSIAEAEGFHGIRWARGVGFTAPLWTGATGYVLLGALSDEEISDVLSQSVLSPLASNSPRRPEEVRQRAEHARTRGWSYSENETVEGAAAIAAPVRDGHGVAACLNVYAPTSRGEALRDFVEELVAIAHAASADWTSLSTTSGSHATVAAHGPGTTPPS